MTWIVDLLFVLILLGGIFLGANRGFVKSIAKFAGTLFAIIFAVTFAISLSNALENWFGMTTALSNWIGSWFTAPEYAVAFDRTMTGADLADALSSINGIARAIILQSFGTAETIPPTATPGQLLGLTLGGWASVLICFIILFVIIKFGVYLLAKGMDSLVGKLAFFRILNQTLGGLFGLVKSLLIVLILLMICSWLPIEALHTYLSDSVIVGAIYNSEWFYALMEYFVSGQWFHDYVTQFFQG